MTDCELCNLERLTQWHYEDDTMVICDCLTCGTPMLVFRGHGIRPLAEILYAREKIIERYGKRLIKMRTKARRIKDHWHWHLKLEKE